MMKKVYKGSTTGKVGDGAPNLMIIDRMKDFRFVD